MANTPRHLMSYISMAENDPNAEHHIIVFNHLKDDRVFISIVRMFFSQCDLFDGFLIIDEKPVGMSRVVYNNNNFIRISKILSEVVPDIVYTGDDCMIEFQYTAYLTAGKSQCVYVDEGTGSYNDDLGIDPVIGWGKIYIGTIINKIVYGPWFEHPPVLGATQWVHSSILCFPELANYGLAKKPISLFDKKWLFNRGVNDFLQLYVSYLGIDLGLMSKISCLYILPGGNIIEKEWFDVEKYKEKIIRKSGDVTVGVKYHPGQQGDPLDIANLNVLEIPRSLPLEIILPVLKLDLVIGDLSSALMSVKWLNPNARVVAEKYSTNRAVENLMAKFEQAGIEVVDSTGDYL